MAETQDIPAGEDIMARLDELEGKLETERRMREVTNSIHSLPLDQLILSIREDVQRLVLCDRVTIFAKDPRRDEIYSKHMDGGEVKEIRVPVNMKSLAGFVATKRRTLRINDVYDAKEVASVDPQLKFDPSWDKRTGYRTKQVIAAPVLKDGRLMGVVQCINSKDGKPFRPDHEVILADLVTSLGIAFFNQQKMNARSGPYDTLYKEGIITPDTVDQAEAAGRKEGVSPEQLLITKFKVKKEDLGRSFSTFYRCPFVNFSNEYMIPHELLEQFTVDYLKHHQFCPLSKAGNRATVVMAKPKNLMLRDDISRRLGMEVIVNVAVPEDVIAFIDYFMGSETSAATQTTTAVDLGDIINEIESEDTGTSKGPSDDEIVKEDDVGMVRLVNQIIEQAYAKGASDIHVEPYIDGDVLIRTRVDGVCSEHARLPMKFRRNIVARIKIMAGLDIAERRIPQSGKIRFKNFGNLDIELRVETIPTTGGNEDSVMRILAASKPIPFEKLGMEKDNFESFLKVVQEPYGIILCVGPTGSGKTTTLHSVLGYRNKPDVKIWTAEDPVEITQAGLRQVQVLPKIGFTFERALRSFLRLDPDIIMIGEMRDFETTSAGIEASLTGHMVFSTLHTNNAPETVTRLLDMGIDPFSFGDSLLAVLAQRLMRTLCKNCKKEYVPDPEEWEALKREFDDDALWEKQGYVREKTKLYKPAGCDRCNKSGFKGRCGIHELLVVDDEIKQLIYSKSLSAKVREVGVRNGMVQLKQDGIRKVIKGLATIKEVKAVCTT